MNLEKVINQICALVNDDNKRIFFDFESIDEICDFSHFISNFRSIMYISTTIEKKTVKIKLQYIKSSDCYQLRKLKISGMPSIKFDEISA